MLSRSFDGNKFIYRFIIVVVMWLVGWMDGWLGSKAEHNVLDSLIILTQYYKKYINIILLWTTYWLFMFPSQLYA